MAVMIEDGRFADVKPAERDGAEVDGPDVVVDLLEPDVLTAEQMGDVDPFGVPSDASVGGDLPCSRACIEAFDIEVLAVLEHEVGGTTEACGENTERFPFAVAALELLEMSLAAGVVLEEEHGGLAEGLFAMGVTDLGCRRRSRSRVARMSRG